MTTYHKKRGIAKKRKWPYILAGSILALIIGVVISVFSWYTISLRPLSSSQEEIIITIPVGATVEQIGVNLQSNGVIRSSKAFDWYIRLKGFRGQMQAGGYKFTPSQSVEEIVRNIADGRVATDLVTILPAQRLDQLEASFLVAGYSHEEVLNSLNPANYAGHPALADKPADASLEGYLYPESFQRSSTTKLDTVIGASLDEMAKALTPELKSAFQKQGLTVHQAVILASIVEKEVSNSQDRPIVAQVFLKRYKSGIMLGSDVTAFYGAKIVDAEPSVTFDSPYNTRIYSGLPPGPINNVGAESLRAVAFPADTDYLYFVSGDDGKTYFSYTLAEHESLTAQHCIELCN